MSLFPYTGVDFWVPFLKPPAKYGPGKPEFQIRSILGSVEGELLHPHDGLSKRDTKGEGIGRRWHVFSLESQEMPRFGLQSAYNRAWVLSAVDSLRPKRRLGLWGPCQFGRMMFRSHEDASMCVPNGFCHEFGTLFAFEGTPRGKRRLVMLTSWPKKV